MTDFCVNCGKRDCEMICPECNERTLTIYEQKLIAEFLAYLKRKKLEIEDHGENIMNGLYEELEEEIEKWELRKMSKEGSSKANPITDSKPPKSTVSDLIELFPEIYNEECVKAQEELINRFIEVLDKYITWIAPEYYLKREFENDKKKYEEMLK